MLVLISCRNSERGPEALREKMLLRRDQTADRFKSVNIFFRNIVLLHTSLSMCGFLFILCRWNESLKRFLIFFTPAVITWGASEAPDSQTVSHTLWKVCLKIFKMLEDVPLKCLCTDFFLTHTPTQKGQRWALPAGSYLRKQDVTSQLLDYIYWSFPHVLLYFSLTLFLFLSQLITAHLFIWFLRVQFRFDLSCRHIETLHR